MMRVSVAQRAYIAGFIEGEGSFCLTRPMRKKQGVPQYHYQIRPSISVSQKNKRPLEFIQKIYGGRIRYVKHTGVNATFLWFYDLRTRQGILRLITDIYPFLIASRTRYRAACVYKLAQLLGVGKYLGNQRLPQENLDKREKIYSLWSRSRR